MNESHNENRIYSKHVLIICCLCVLLMFFTQAFRFVVLTKGNCCSSSPVQHPRISPFNTLFTEVIHPFVCVFLHFYRFSKKRKAYTDTLISTKNAVKIFCLL